MKPIEYRILQGLLWFAAASHIVIGGGIMFSDDFQRALAPLYGAEVNWTAQFTYILRPLGAFMFVFGILIAAAALDPLRHRAIVYGLCGVLSLRVLQRVLFYREVQEGFGINLGWYLAMGGFFLAMAIAIVLLLQRLIRSPTRASAE
jgi:hypothetical protein